MPKQEEPAGEQQEVPKQEEPAGEQQEVPKREEPAGEQQEVPKREEASGGQPGASTQEGTTGEQAGEAKQEETPGEQTGAKAGQSNSQESLKSPEAQKEDGTLPADGSTVQKGRLHLSLIYSLPYSAPETLNSGLQAVLTREGQQLEASFSMLEGESVSKKAEASFVDLEPGQYHLRISGSHFAVYDQDVEIQAMDQKMQFMDVYTGMDFSDMERHPGVMGYGDVNSDGVIDENDKTELIRAIHLESTDSAFDLNQDQKGGSCGSAVAFLQLWIRENGILCDKKLYSGRDISK